MTPILWDRCRRGDGTISLALAARMTGCNITEQAHDYLVMVESIMLINSRQAAAVAIATALEISARSSDGDSKS